MCILVDVCVCHIMPVEVRGHLLQESVLTFHYVGPQEDQTQVIRLVTSKCLYLKSSYPPASDMCLYLFPSEHSQSMYGMKGSPILLLS